MTAFVDALERSDPIHRTWELSAAAIAPALLGIATLTSVAVLGNWLLEKSHQRQWQVDIREQRQEAANGLRRYHRVVSVTALIAVALTIIKGSIFYLPTAAIGAVFCGISLTVLTLTAANYALYRLSVGDDGNDRVLRR